MDFIRRTREGGAVITGEKKGSRNIPEVAQFSCHTTTMKFRLILALLWAFSLFAQEQVSDLLHSGHFREALERVDADLRGNPREPKLWTAKGIALAGLDRTPESLTAFVHALALSPAFTPALQGAAEVSYKIRDPRAKVFLDRLISKDPENQTANAMLGVLAFEARDCQSANKHFDRAAAVIEGNEQALSMHAVCLFKLNQPQLALPVLSRLLVLQPDNKDYRYNLALCQVLSGKTADALVTMQPWTVNSVRDADALNLLANSEAAENQLPAAIFHLRQAIKIAPEDEGNYVDFAALALQHDSLDLASEIVAIGLAHVPHSARLYATQGIIKAQQSKYEEAAADFEEANRLDAAQAYGAVGLGVLYTEEKRPGEAAAILRARVRQSPNDFALNFLLADALVREGPEMTPKDLEEASASLHRSIRSKPSFAKAHTLLGKLELKAGKTKVAIEQFQLALQLDPSDRTALNQLVVALQAAGRRAEAKEAARKLRDLLTSEMSADVSHNRVRLMRVP